MSSVPSSRWPVFELQPRRHPFLRRSELTNDSARMFILVVALGFLAIKLISAAATGDLSELAPLAATAVAIFGGAFFVYRRMRLRVTPDAIERVGGLPARRVARHEVVGVVRVPVTTFSVQEGDLDVLINAQGHCVLRLRGRMWEDGDLDRAWAQAGLGIQYVPEPMSYRQLDSWIPGSTRIWESRPLEFGAIVGIALVGITIAAAIALT